MCICFGDGIFKCLQIDFAGGLFVAPHADTIASGFLIVQGEVLQIDINTFGLDTGSFSSADFAADEGVFGIILEVASGIRSAVDVHAGAVNAGVALATDHHAVVAHAATNSLSNLAVESSCQQVSRSVAG